MLHAAATKRHLPAASSCRTLLRTMAEEQRGREYDKDALIGE